MTAAYILTGFRIKKKGDLASIYRGIGLMQESTAYDEILEEGISQGIIQGITQGQGWTLLRLGRKRFGPADAFIEAELAAIKDLDCLERLVDAILTAESWPELRATS